MDTRSLLFVCIGNTCRSPMAAALAKRLWPHCSIESAGTAVTEEEQGGPQPGAVDVMNKVGLDIQGHRSKSLSSINLGDYETIIFLDKDAKKSLLEAYDVQPAKLIDLFVDDPFGYDIGQYLQCRDHIASRLLKLKTKY